MIRRLIIEVPVAEYNACEEVAVPRSDPRAAFNPWHTFQVRTLPPGEDNVVVLEVWQEWRDR